MENKLEKKYGLITAICMVVGIVIGSGIFFKAQDILNITQGNMPLGIIAWIIGGVIMLISIINFSTFATYFQKVNGVVDYAEEIVGSKFAYYVGWFMTTIYYPTLTSVLAWVSARYTLILFDASADITSGLCLSLACLYLCSSYALNALAPKLSGKFQVSTTFVKLVPLLLMAVVGLVVGLVNGNTVNAFSSFTSNSDSGVSMLSMLFSATVATAFAYEGWIIATSINAELKDAKKNLPIALVIGGVIVVLVYIVYYIGLAGAATVDTLMVEGAQTAFKNVFGNIAGTVLNTFIVISCLGTLNGLMLGTTRGMYSLAVRGQGPVPERFAEVSASTNMPTNSSIFGLFACGLWLFYFYGANLTTPIFGLFSFDSSELPIITTYALYIPIFIMFIVKYGKENKFKNIVMPILGVISSLFMVFAAFYAHGITKYQVAAAAGEFSFPVLFYLIIFAVIMFVGKIFDGSKKEEVK